MSGPAAVRSEATWSAEPPSELANFLGMIGRVQSVQLKPSRLALLRSAVARVSGDPGAEATAGIVEVCPDPLVFAIASGLSRLRLLDSAIDGGSEWEQAGVVPTTPLTAVSRIAEIAERTTSAGRRLIRTCYETEFRDQRGQFIGIARGFSVDTQELNS